MKELKQWFKNKDVFLTGHTGFKGTWLSQILVNFGANVYGYSLNPNTEPNFLIMTILYTDIFIWYFVHK
jgi:CDP-glucose 4,6-dehydratase